MLNNLTIKAKMMLGGAVIGISFVTSTLVSISSINEVQSANDDIRALNHIQIAVDEAQSLVQGARIATLRYAADPSEKDKQLAQDRAHKAAEMINQIMSQPASQPYATFLKDMGASVSSYEKAFAQRSQAQDESLRKQALDTMNDAGRQINQITQDLGDKLRADRNRMADAVSSRSNQAKTLSITISVIGMALAAVFGAIIALSVIGPVGRMSQLLQTVARTGDFSQRCQLSGKDEIAHMGHAFTGFIHFIQTSIAEVNKVMNAMAKGDFKQRVTADLPGDLGTLKTQVNLSLDQLANVMSALSSSAQAMQQGNFSHRAQVRAEGTFNDMVVALNDSMQSLNTAIADINRVMTEMTNGQFNARMTQPMQGDLDKLKTAVNNSLERIEAAFSEIGSVMAAQANNNMTLRIQGNYAGQLAILKDNINSTASQLENTLSNILGGANEVERSAGELANANQEMSQRIQEQAAALEETASAMEEMTAAVRSAADSAQNANHRAQEAVGMAKEGNNVMKQTVDAMHTISEGGNQIAQFVAIIDNIAFQTNLLALNAAVEAARAGEQGRGFAVVAGEVRTLAQKSADAAREIKSLVDSMTGEVTQGVHLATQAGSALSDITTAIEEVGSRVHQIADSSREQATGIDQVNKAISNMDHNTQQSAAMVEETSAATENMAQQANDVRGLISVFTLSHQQTASATTRPRPKAVSNKPAALPAPTASTAGNKRTDSEEWSEF